MTLQRCEHFAIGGWPFDWHGSKQGAGAGGHFGGKD
tara:strand:+ start:1081 stop:1188 length:108 start_codon:yes stop_codon:yes gene_type:complete